MDFIIGGAFQGKLEYAVKKHKLDDSDIFTCSENAAVSFERKCIYAVQEFTLYCVKNSLDATEIFRNNRKKWKNGVIICEDIFCGVVPLGADMRAWRDMTGRLCAYLSSEADSVERIFCGLEQKLK
ncbi:MAG: bifunctional adenosylcobinamide kinase/adenosylcobinamide-phosphate guanylyltransferase [Clostridia bacterium]|nr:bifunctional adenosylcobinamide kinase/adenosylcobinamide-phosphate guanylyltransferase [Clostridia bacterium]